ncbi:MAG: DUF6885 family protein [Solirubrobacteraceae bacterium]
MTASPPLEMTLLPGARALLAIHARELPQRDDLCGAFCGALALRAAGVERYEGEPLDQDAVALAAGSVVSRLVDTGNLPRGEGGRRDYRLSLPFVEDAAVSGTTAAGVVGAIAALSGGALAAIPYAGPWTAGTLGGLFEAAAALERPVTLIANLATRHLWGSHARAAELLDYLCEGELHGPPADWEVGHFACVVGRVLGPRGCLYGVADTYPSLGAGGVHLQPAERLAAAIARRDRSRETLASEHPCSGQPAGGVVVVLAAADAPHVRGRAGASGLVEGIWDNGTVTAEAR